MRLVLLAALLVPAAWAQPSNWTLPSSGASVTLAADKPFFPDGSPYEGVTSVWTLSAWQPLGPGVRLVAELPVAFAETVFSTDTFQPETYAIAGNVQLGAEADLATLPITLGGYVRLPTASIPREDRPAQFVGVYTEFEQIGTFLERTATVSALAETRISADPASPFAVRLRVIPQVLIPTGDSNAFFRVDDPEGYVGLAAHAVYDAGQVAVSGGVSSLTILTEDVDDATEVFAGVSADIEAGRVRPGLTIRAPFSDGVGDVLNSVVGLRLSLAL